MPLTPADVHNVAFSKPPIGKRGYNEDEVDQFLDLVEDTLAEIQEENEDLRQQIEELKAEAKQGGISKPAMASASFAKPSVDEAAIRREIESKLKAEYDAKLADARKYSDKSSTDMAALRSELEAAKADAKKANEEAAKAKAAAANSKLDISKTAFAAAGAGAGLATAETHMQAAKVLGLAQEMADRLTSEAQNDSKSMLDEARSASERQIQDADVRARATLADARAKADKQLAEADSRSRALIEDAQKKSEQTLSEANSRAEAQVRQAEDKANVLQADAERKHTEIMATVQQQQSALEKRISELRTFEREYRTRLKTLLQSQLEELESRGTTAPDEKR
ncbi:cell division protein [Corynebacterium ulcerans]|uniref:DivIVA domain-containing protein n=1 Tax=Corynebacterium ulcerans TaxID=65058 RepID=UPI0006BB5759|nr:DivIVA domain-containing protein [Corynebacterium ulcerans]KPH75436.1 cell division protein [Corynebacterium ulcerans]